MDFLKNLFPGKKNGHTASDYSIGETLKGISRMNGNEVLAKMNTRPEGLHANEERNRLRRYGQNVVVHEKKKPWYVRVFETLVDPLTLLLIALGVISLASGDNKAAIIIGVMLLISVILRLYQELKAEDAAEKLKSMVRTTALVIRNGERKEIPLKHLVVGDVVVLSAGDMIPADVRLLSAKDLYVNQASLTGESVPVEKFAEPEKPDGKEPLELGNICFLGTNVEIGSGTAVVVATGPNTYFGTLAEKIVGQRAQTSFDQGIDRFTWMMIKFIAVMAPLVFLINGIGKGNWVEAFFFATAVTVGLTPEMLPMIVTVNLSRGATRMAEKKVIVKRLNSIQNFGAMDILCTDKTGTLTEGRVVLEKHIDVHGHENEGILDLAYVNSTYQTGLRNLIDAAIMNHIELKEKLQVEKNYQKIDEIPFDFVRRRMSVVVRNKEGKHLLICKGAVEEVISLSKNAEADGKVFALGKRHRDNAAKLARDLNSDGFRVIALAYREMPAGAKSYGVGDEKDMTLLGFFAFLDPAKESAGKAIARLRQNGVRTKILTGDNEIVTKKICTDVGMTIHGTLSGAEIEKMADEKLSDAAENTTIFYKLSPSHKERIIRALQKRGHVLGFLGDGINDAPALRAADVGISVNSAVDIAKESSDIILLENSLLILGDGVLEGRRTFGNINKYLKMTASSNFGNMFSVVGASLFLPFLPMLPLQVLVNNLLYDMSQIPIPTDNVDEEYLTKPRQWRVDLLEKFVIFIGPISSIFDFLSYGMMIYVFGAWTNPALFQTGWFVESLLSQTLIIHVIRTNRIPFIQSRASLPLTIATLGICVFGMWLPFSPLADALGFVPLPPLYFVLLAAMLVTYLALTQLVKNWFIKKYALE